MVHRKQARKKPKDLVVLADEGLPAGQLRRGGDSGGGDVRRTALAPLPNYMRATTCSGAKLGGAPRREDDTAPPTTTKPPQVRAKVVFSGAPPLHAGRATCSSAMKGPGGPAAPHVCNYAYCSFKGHVHASVVPLDAFLASRRRLIKTQQTMKLKGASPFRKPNHGGGGDGYFVEIHAGAAAPPMGSDASCSSGLSTEEIAGRMDQLLLFDHLSGGEDKPKDAADSLDRSCGSVTDGSLESLGSTKNRGRQDNTLLEVNHEDHDSFGACKSDITDELGPEHEQSIPQDVGRGVPKEDTATSQMKKLHISGTGRRTSQEEGCKQQMRRFRPKAPNFLPVETGPEAEKVDLKHQAVSDRRDAEEWMVDYALRKAVNKLARVQKRKVEMLVQAFETVLPTTAGEKKDHVQHDDNNSTFTLSRPSTQACS